MSTPVLLLPGIDHHHSHASDTVSLSCGSAPEGHVLNKLIERTIPRDYRTISGPLEAEIDYGSRDDAPRFYFRSAHEDYREPRITEYPVLWGLLQYAEWSDLGEEKRHGAGLWFMECSCADDRKVYRVVVACGQGRREHYCLPEDIHVEISRIARAFNGGVVVFPDLPERIMKVAALFGVEEQARKLIGQNPGMFAV